MKKVIICDLDGTLCNVEHRRHFVDGSGKKDYRSFYENMKEDTPNEWCKNLVVSMAQHGFLVVFVTARPSEYFKLTSEWLMEHLPLPRTYYAQYHVRPFIGNTDPDYVLKRNWLRTSGLKDNILFVIDDRKRVVDMWREEGLTVLQCDNWEERKYERKIKESSKTS